MLSSILITTLNPDINIFEKTLNLIIEDVEQEDCNIVIIDDGSILPISESIGYRSSKLKIIRLNHNVGIAAALNIGLQNIDAKYIFRMDSDDIWIKGRYKKQISFLEQNKKIAVVGGAIHIKGPSINRVHIYPEFGSNLIKYGMKYCPHAHPSVCINRGLLGNDYYYDEKFKCEDYELWLRLWSLGYQTANINSTLIEYNISENQLTNKNKKIIYTDEILIKARFFRSQSKIINYNESIVLAYLHTLSRMPDDIVDIYNYLYAKVMKDDFYKKIEISKESYIQKINEIFYKFIHLYRYSN